MSMITIEQCLSFGMTKDMAEALVKSVEKQVIKAVTPTTTLTGKAVGKGITSGGRKPVDPDAMLEELVEIYNRAISEGDDSVTVTVKGEPRTLSLDKLIQRMAKYQDDLELRERKAIVSDQWAALDCAGSSDRHLVGHDLAYRNGVGEMHAAILADRHIPENDLTGIRAEIFGGVDFAKNHYIGKPDYANRHEGSIYAFSGDIQWAQRIPSVEAQWGSVDYSKDIPAVETSVAEHTSKGSQWATPHTLAMLSVDTIRFANELAIAKGIW